MNTKRNKTKTLLVVGLLLAVSGLTLGFAAFSNTLTIKSSATVTPDASTFSVVFSSSETSVESNDIVPTIVSSASVKPTASNAKISGTTLSDISIGFTEPGQHVMYGLYAYNNGEYDAYLNAVKFNNAVIDSIEKGANIVCTIPEESEATPELVEAACEDIKIEIVLSTDWNADDEYYETVYTYSSTNDTINNVLISKETGYSADIMIKYPSNSAIADGAFDVHIGDITLDFSTVD